MAEEKITTIYSPFKLDAEEIELIVNKFPFIEKTAVVNIVDEKLIAGVKIKTANKIIDLSLKHRLDALRTDQAGQGKISYQIKQTGSVKEVKDEVAILNGFDSIAYGELIQFESGLKAMVIDIEENEIGTIVLGDYSKIAAGDTAFSTGLQASVSVSSDLIGRVVDGIGEPIDGAGEISAQKRYPLEKIAPGVIKRQSVNRPLQTGIKSIDALIPIGRGQRELIIGDRATGKTTLAVDSIINQKNENVICIYCAVGQKQSKVASVVDLLKKHQAFDYSIVVSASASDPASLQYLAPYTATAIAEFFMDQGKDVLVVYDDLSKHAWAYRQLSLVLRRPAGREAYPGDIFYLHSRLLERSSCLNKKSGGGSITALPIIETLEGDVSAYIPTNIISITDGQIFLEADLFNAGIRPAVNIGISVSRVGGNAQVKAMKQVAGKLKLDLAQYRAMAAFSQFESELDEATKKFLNRGAKITQLLKQNKHRLFPLSHQICSIWAGTQGYLDQLDQDQVPDFEQKLIEHLVLHYKKLIDRLEKEKVIKEEDENELKKAVKEIISQYYEPAPGEEKN